MKKARRKPRKIGQDDEDEQQQSAGSSVESSPVVRRARPASRTFTPKKPSNLRASLLPSIADEDVEAAPQRGTIAERDPFTALERKKSARKSLLTPAKLPYRSPEATDRPSYSADYLAELKQSQQSTPRVLHTTTATSDDSDVENDSATQKPLDIASKFGTSDTVLRTSSSNTSPAPHIPTDAEIREKKERRRRLAREEKDFISLNDDGRQPSGSDSSGSDSDAGGRRRRRDNDTLIIPADDIVTKDADPGTRIGVSALDDDDLGEGYDDFVSDSGKVALGRKARREQSEKRRREIAAQIAGAEGGSDDDRVAGGDGDDDDDPEERARLKAYEAAQTRHGTYGLRSTTAHHRDGDAAREREERWRRITTQKYKLRPLPTMKGEQERFRKLVEEKRHAREECERRIEGVRREREECEREMERVQGLVREAGERLERLTGANAEAEAVKEREERRKEREKEADGYAPAARGLESSSHERAGLGARAGLGMASGLASSAGGIGLESFAGMAGLPSSSAAGDE